jgi:hypothetical protein
MVGRFHNNAMSIEQCVQLNYVQLARRNKGFMKNEAD